MSVLPDAPQPPPPPPPQQRHHQQQHASPPTSLLTISIHHQQQQQQGMIPFDSLIGRVVRCFGSVPFDNSTSSPPSVRHEMAHGTITSSTMVNIHPSRVHQNRLFLPNDLIRTVLTFCDPVRDLVRLRLVNTVFMDCAEHVLIREVNTIDLSHFKSPYHGGTTMSNATRIFISLFYIRYCISCKMAATMMTDDCSDAAHSVPRIPHQPQPRQLLQQHPWENIYVNHQYLILLSRLSRCGMVGPVHRLTIDYRSIGLSDLHSSLNKMPPSLREVVLYNIPPTMRIDASVDLLYRPIQTRQDVSITFIGFALDRTLLDRNSTTTKYTVLNMGKSLGDARHILTEYKLLGRVKITQFPDMPFPGIDVLKEHGRALHTILQSNIRVWMVQFLTDLTVTLEVQCLNTFNFRKLYDQWFYAKNTVKCRQCLLYLARLVRRSDIYQIVSSDAKLLDDAIGRHAPRGNPYSWYRALRVEMEKSSELMDDLSRVK